ncbi:MAG TPA: M48 family metallopeptidase [Candidatus Binatia bacterium]|jgi:Zn-dependent protease with chaperone function|nr:M48 family metallopeptidase [Candidatus Binatia bacterium]
METAAAINEATPDAAPPVRQYFSGQVARVPLPLGYRLGLIAVAVAMLTLPLIYLGLVVLFCWGLYNYATRGADMFFPLIGGTRRVYFSLMVLYSVPLFAGLILVVFMIKPIFARWRVREAPVALSHLQHPELFRFIGQLCQTLGAPIPSRVDVDLSVNASAGFRAGFGSLFGNDIKLAFGLPLAAGMTCREFAGVLAHELGHFTQRTAMRFGFIITMVNRWFARVVFERDAWDYVLEEATNQSPVTLVICAFARLGIGLTRGLLWLLMLAGHALSSFLSRQMEFHADACAISVAGTDGFVSLGRKLLVLGASTEQARVQFKNRIAPKLPDDLSNYVALLASQCAGQTQGRVFQTANARKTGWLDSHPADAERTARAMRAHEPGLIQDSRPATELFGNFAELSRGMTRSHYQMLFGHPLPPDRLFSVQAPTHAAPETAAEEAAIKSYFAGLGLFLRPLLPEPGARVTIGAASAKLQQLIDAKQLLQSADLLAAREALKDLDARWLRAVQAHALQQAGVERIEELCSLPGADTADLTGLLRGLREQQEEIGSQLQPYEAAGRLRLMTALSLLRTPDVALGLSNTQQLQEEALDLLHVAGKLNVVFPLLLELRGEFAIQEALFGLPDGARPVPAHGVLTDSIARANGFLARIQEQLGSTGYPFEQAKGPSTLVEYARAKEYEADPVRMTHKEVASHLEMLLALYFRLLGRLVAIASQVEAQLSEPHAT